jgi:putative membrane protein
MGKVTTHWQPSLPVLVCYALVVCCHLAGYLAERRGSTPERQRQLGQQALAFHGGLLVVLIAVISPIRYWASVYIWVHALQDVLLAFVAPSLIVLGAPWQPLRRAWHLLTRSAGRARQAIDPADQPDTSGSRRWLAGPILVAVAFNVGWIGWHMPALFNPTRSSVPVQYTEYGCYLLLGTLFWLQLIGSAPFRPAMSVLRRVVLLVATTAVGTVLGMMLVFSSGEFYPVYGGAAHHIMTVLDDQQLAGAVLWMGVLPPLIVAGVALLMRWFDDEESAGLTADINKLLTNQRRSSWPSRPVIR